MGADVYASSPAARRVFDLASEALGFSLSTICFEGPDETLRETVNTQPALVATSLAVLAAMQEAAGATLPEQGEPALAAPLRPAFVAGHSVGEYSALAVAGVLTIGETLRLVRERGRLMHQEGQACPSGMAAVLGMDAAALTALCEEATADALARLAPDETHPGAGRVVVANDNAPGQIVISGAQDALERAMALARERGARRVVPLTVSGAFHSPVMTYAAQGLSTAMERISLRDASIPVISNISATPLTASADLRAELARQIESPVQWSRSVEYLARQGVGIFVEIGAGQVLSGLIKRIAKGTTILSAATTAEAAAVAEQLREQLAS